MLAVPPSADWVNGRQETQRVRPLPWEELFILNNCASARRLVQPILLATALMDAMIYGMFVHTTLTKVNQGL